MVGGNTYSFTPSDNSAATVASTINAQYGNLVQATAVNVGSAANPDYRISLQSATLGPVDLDIQAPARPTCKPRRPPPPAMPSARRPAPGTLRAARPPIRWSWTAADYTIAPADNSAASVAAAINALSGNPVQATVVNLGASGSPDERIQLQSTSAGVSTVDLAGLFGKQSARTGNAGCRGLRGEPDFLDLGSDARSFRQPRRNIPSRRQAPRKPSPWTITAPTGVAAAINALAGNPVTATVVDLGTAGQSRLPHPTGRQHREFGRLRSLPRAPPSICRPRGSRPGRWPNTKSPTPA